jgi:hypothetical protein
MGVNADLRVTSSYTNLTTAGTGGTAPDSYSDSPALSWSAGTGTAQVDRSWSRVNPSLTGAETLTLSALSGPFGSTVAFAHVKKWAFRNTSTFAATIKPGATHGWTPLLPAAGVVVGPGGVLVFGDRDGAGLAVTSGSSDQVTIDFGANAGSYRLDLGGVSV